LALIGLGLGQYRHLAYFMYDISVSGLNLNDDTEITLAQEYTHILFYKKTCTNN